MSEIESTSAGIDVSASRGFDLCVLDERRRVVLLVKARDLDALAMVVRGLPSTATIAVDAPSSPSHGTGPRASEHALLSLGISLYPTPPSEEEAPAWMKAGFALYRMLARHGFPLARAGAAAPADGILAAGSAVECYPHLSYLALSGTRRGKTSKQEWSRAALRGRVSGLPSDPDQDQLDAACAALTAWHFARGEWIAYGDPSEGVIVAPRTAHDPAGIRRRGAEQLTLPIAESGPRAAVEPLRRTSFPERVLGIVARIPHGKVATYGDVARWAGNPSGARAVGTIVARHAFEVPSHRVVDASGRPAAYPEDTGARLRAEGIALDGPRVDLAETRWTGPR